MFIVYNALHRLRASGEHLGCFQWGISAGAWVWASGGTAPLYLFEILCILNINYCCRWSDAIPNTSPKINEKLDTNELKPIHWSLSLVDNPIQDGSNCKIGIMEVSGFVPNDIPQNPASHFLFNSLAVLVRHNQSQKCLQIDPTSCEFF